MTMRHGSRPATMDAIESASQDELRTLQLQRMKWSVKHAYDNVPHYRTVFDAAGVHPDDLKELADLSKFPFLTKKDLRDNAPVQPRRTTREAGRATSAGTAGVRPTWA